VSVNSTDPMIGRLLDGRYQIRSRIARGGMASVYLATDLRLERRVAIKIMHGHLADDSKFKERFIQEARSAARLAHPNVVNVFDQGQDSDMAYLVMEYLPGITLRDLLQEHKTLTTEQTLDIMESVLAGLAAAHKAGIVHRDIKPENVLLADDGRIKIGDFGLARAASANTATGAALLGTIAYLSPELVTRGIADTRSDIYAVGIMMYEMLTGEQPFKGEQPMQIAYQHANDAVPAPSKRNPRVPAELDELVSWATARDAEDRPKDARVMLDKLYETHSTLMTTLPAAGSTQRTMVMPTATRGDTAETQILGTRGSSSSTGPNPGSPPSMRSSISTLRTPPKRRRRRWIVVLVVLALIAAASATAGIYFGSQTSIPTSLAGMTPEEATQQLEKLGLVVNPERGQTDDPKIASGLVVKTKPPLGSPVTKGTKVTLLLSTGPKPLPVPAFAGMGEDVAKAAIKDAPFTLADPIIRQFDQSVASGVVIDALAANGSSLTGVPTYGELQPVTLVVSVGPIPDVGGKTVDEAKTILAGKDLQVGEIREGDYSDSVPQGNVLSTEASNPDAPVRPGDSVDLLTSKGPAPVEVPDVVGQSWANAKPQLLDAGFDLSYSPIADLNPNAVIVSNLDPDGGTVQPKGSKVTVSFTF
jgi:serine/threonine-protein kinase